MVQRGKALLLYVSIVSAACMGVMMSYLARAFVGPWAGSYDLGFFWPAVVATFVGMMTAGHLQRKGY